MKMPFIIALIVVVIIGGYNEYLAKQITKEESLIIAKQFYQEQCILKRTGLNKSTTTLDFKLNFVCTNTNLLLKSGSTAPNENTAYYYVYNVGVNQGFVIVSGDDRTKPILGYSNEGEFIFEKMPENVKAFMENYKHQIKTIITTNDSTIKMKSMNVTLNDSAVAPLITTKWGQLSPYNSKVPISAPTGCVATAMAQIMNYHKWPIHGISNKSYTYNGTTYSANFASTTYDWANMKDKYTAKTSSASCEAVSTLMYHSGVALTTQYSADVSIVTTDKISPALINYFGYDKETQLIWSQDYTPTQWKYKVKSEINARRPIMVFGSDGKAIGHEFIADGYDRYNFIHINWGWDGEYNGFYETDPLDASIYFVPGSLIVGIQKPIESTNSTLCYKGLGLANNSTKSRNISITVELSITEENKKSFIGKIGVAFYKNDIFYNMIDSSNTIINANTTLTKSYSITIPDTFAVGTYSLVPIFKNDTDINWSKIKLISSKVTDENVEFVVNETDVIIFLNSKTMNCKKGDFKTKFSFDDWANIKRLVVSGEIDQFDLLYMAEGKSIKSIDLKNATICDTKIDTSEIAYGGKPTNFDEFFKSLSSKLKNFEKIFWHGIYYYPDNPNWQDTDKDGIYEYTGVTENRRLEYNSRTGEYNIYNTDVEVSGPLALIKINGNGIIIGGNGIMADAFNNSKLENITLPSNLKYIAPMAFANCPNLKTIMLPDSVLIIGDSLFYNCQKLTEIKFTPNIKDIGLQPIKDYGPIKTLILPDSLVIIHEHSFNYLTSLTSLTIPSSVKSIGRWSFIGCSKLTSLIIPSSVDSIGYGAFQSCSSLNAVYAYRTIPVSLSNPNFSYVNKAACVLHVPYGSKAAYQSAAVWKDFKNIVEDLITSEKEYVTNTLPEEFMIEQNYPNPFNPTTTIKYAIPKTSQVNITVFDLLGREVEKLVNEEKHPGNYEVNFNGSNLSSGVYLYQIKAGYYTQTKKFIFLK